MVDEVVRMIFHSNYVLMITKRGNIHKVGVYGDAMLQRLQEQVRKIEEDYFH